MSVVENEVSIRSDIPEDRSVMEASQSSRQAAEVQSAMVIAKRFPRDQIAAKNRIIESCKRQGLAEVAQYVYPRGGTKVSGPSIRLAESMAQNWGNLDFGIVELDQRNGASSVMAYCVDLETNVRQSKIFTVPHIRHTRNGSKKLTDPRDIYEMVANNGARRLRACILGIIPGDVKEAALAQCDKTLAGGSNEPLIDRVQKMVSAFGGISVSQEMIEKKLGHKIDVTNESEFVMLRKIYTSIKDGMSTREQWFEFEGVKQVEQSDLSAIGKPKEAETKDAERTPVQIADFYRDKISEAPDQSEIDVLVTQAYQELEGVEGKKELLDSINDIASKRFEELEK